MKSKLKIGAIYELDLKTPKHQEIIGQEGIIFSIYVGAPLFFEYTTEELKGQCLRTSSVLEINETDYGLLVTTKNSVYRFNYI